MSSYDDHNEADQYVGKTALVTGASSGIGWEISRELARRGAQVGMVARRSDRLEELAQQIANEGGRASPLPCDVTNESSVMLLAEKVKAEYGKIDLLVNNAGREMLKPLQITKVKESRELLELNVLALAEVTRAMLGRIHNGGGIINMASAAGLAASPGLSLYAASKSAVITLTKSWAKELSARRIRVNAVAPGIVRTEMADRMFGNLTPQQTKELETAHPLGFGTPHDIALAVAFLGSEDAAWITGHTLVVDGGFSA